MSVWGKNDLESGHRMPATCDVDLKRHTVCNLSAHMRAFLWKQPDVGVVKYATKL